MTPLSADARARIERETAKYPADQRQSAVMSALTIAQRERGWLSDEAMDEVASFYTMYDLKPTGRYKLTICTNLPCALSGATEAAAQLKKRLGVGFGETTPDGRFTLKEGECMGACGDAPVMLVNNHRMVSWMKGEKLDAFVDELAAAADRGEGAPNGGSAR